MNYTKIKIMKPLKKVALAIVLITLFASCQSNSDVKEILSKPDTRKEMMDTIANDSNMSKEMMDAMVNSKNSRMIMMQYHMTMINMMKGNPGMMQSMMSDMMETCKSDTAMMSGLCKTMMVNPQMMDMMQKMKEKNMDMSKMKGMDKMDDKTHH